MHDFRDSVTMDEDVFLEIRDLVHDHCGMYFEVDKKYLLEKRLARRLTVHQFLTYNDYLLFLKYDSGRDEELSVAADLLSTNETYFFRESYQLDAFSDEIVPEIVSKKTSKTLRVWSAGCSTGEEPYTIAILLSELIKNGTLSGWNVEVVGSDISQRVLKVARKGVYKATSFRDFDDKYLRYFVEEEDGRRVKDEVKGLVSFSHLNLLDRLKIKLLGSVDIIFCRNVLIYFDKEAKKNVIESFYEKLNDSGYLLLGNSESLMNISTLFTLEHLKNDMVYKRPDRVKLTQAKEKAAGV